MLIAPGTLEGDAGPAIPCAATGLGAGPVGAGRAGDAAADAGGGGGGGAIVAAFGAAGVLAVAPDAPLATFGSAITARSSSSTILIDAGCTPRLYRHVPSAFFVFVPAWMRTSQGMPFLSTSTFAGAPLAAIPRGTAPGGDETIAAPFGSGAPPKTAPGAGVVSKLGCWTDGGAGATEAAGGSAAFPKTAPGGGAGSVTLITSAPVEGLSRAAIFAGAWKADTAVANSENILATAVSSAAPQVAGSTLISIILASLNYVEWLTRIKTNAKMTPPSIIISKGFCVIRLRRFQSQLEVELYQAWGAGAQVVMAVAATGSGKTVFFSKILADYNGVAVVIAHRQELVSQISIALARNGVRHRIIPEKLIKPITAMHIAELGRSYVDRNARRVVAGVQTLVNLDPEKEPWLKQVGLWVGDEGHHFLTANVWGEAITMFPPTAHGLLVTATPCRADGKGLGRHADGLVDKMILAPSMRNLIDMGYLTDYRVICPPVQDLDLSKVDVSSSTGDFNATQVRAAVHRSTQIVGDVVSHYLKWAKGKLGVTFAVDVAAAIELAAAYRAAGVPAEVVSAKTPDAMRAAILRRFKNREILQLVNVDLFGEGFDLPAIEVVSFARPTQSFSLFCQQFGRALRLMLDPTLLANWDDYSDAERRYFISISSKPRAIILDHVGNITRHNGPPDRARTWSLDRREKRSRGGFDDSIPLRTCLNPECLHPYPRVYAVCPECGTRPTPEGRGTPALVDGDLVELDPAVLAAMRGEIQRIDGTAPHIPGADPAVNGSIKKRHWERQQAQGALRSAIAWWSGLETARGRTDVEEQYRRFYFAFGVDVATAQTLGSKEADDLRMRISASLAQFGIDATVNAGLTSVNV